MRPFDAFTRDRSALRCAQDREVAACLPADRTGSAVRRENATRVFLHLGVSVGASLLDGVEPDSSFSRCTAARFFHLLLRVQRRCLASGERQSGSRKLRSMAGLALPEYRACPTIRLG